MPDPPRPLEEQEREAMEAVKDAPPEGTAGWVDTQGGLLARLNYGRGVEVGWDAAKAYLAAVQQPEREGGDRWGEDEWHTDSTGSVIGGAPGNFILVAKSSLDAANARAAEVERERDAARRAVADGLKEIAMYRRIAERAESPAGCLLALRTDALKKARALIDSEVDNATEAALNADRAAAVIDAALDDNEEDT